MTEMTTEQGFALFIKALSGNNFSKEPIRAYTADLKQFIEYLQSNRVDWHNPVRIGRIDIMEFMNHLNSVSRSGTTRARKLASIRHFLSFLKDNSVIAGNPAETTKRAKKEEKEPAVFYKNEYKAILYEARDNPRDVAILTTFLQTGIRESELTHLKLADLDLEHGELHIRQGKGKKDRTIPFGPQPIKALQQYLAVRQDQLVLDEDILFLAHNGTSLNERTIRKLVKKYYDKVEVRKRGVHTLRHTSGAHKIASKMPIATLQKLMGHNRKEITLKYVHIAHTNIKQEQIDTAL